MKKLRFIIAAVLVLCIVQGVWAMAPGGALGGGGKSTQAHPVREGAVVVEPAQSIAPTAAELEASAEVAALVVTNTNTTKDVTIGKSGSSAQSNQENTVADFDKAALTHDAKKEMRRQLKDALQKMRASKKNESPSSPLSDMLILCVILAFFIPPLAVYLYLGSIGTEFWISLILTFLLFVPGVIYSLYVILTN
jgi:uncharacterized membrane protein YqaE (UPF0057 family)